MQIIEKKQHSKNLLNSVLLNAGVKDVELFLSPTDQNDTKVSKLPNIRKACNLIKKHYLDGKIIQLVDSDCDGMTSSAIIYKYLKQMNPSCNISYYIHEKRVHGLTNDFMKFVNEENPTLVIVADAGTNDIEQREELIRKGIDLIVIDHHVEEFETLKGGILINNHARFPENDLNKNLTGATMTYLFCKALDKYIFNTNYSEELKNLAMIGTIGDCASLIDNEVRYLCQTSINDIKCNLLKTFCYKRNKSIYNLTFNDLQFYGIISLINAVIRVGTLHEKKKLYQALIDEEETVSIEKQRFNYFTQNFENSIKTYNIYEYALEIGSYCKKKQDKIVKAEMEKLLETFNKETSIQICVIENQEAESLMGLIANKLVSAWNQPVIVAKLNDEETHYYGSMRGCKRVIDDFKTWCEKTGLFDYVLGHNNASGVKFTANNLNKILEKSKEIVPDNIFRVDKLYQGQVAINDIYLIENNNHIFNYGVTKPFFGVKNINAQECLLQYSKCTVRIIKNGVTYIKFKVTEEQYEKIRRSKFFDVVGFFNLNNWNGRVTPQFIVSTIHPKQNED